MAPKVTEAHRDARRAEIVEAAWRCFARAGFTRTTMRDICAEVGLSAGAVYQYFEGKEALVRAVADAAREEVDARVAPPDAPDPGVALGRSVERFLACFADPENEDAMKVEIGIVAESLYDEGLRETVVGNLHHVVERFAALAGSARAGGQVDPGLDAEAVARVMVSLYYGLEIQKALVPELDVSAYQRAASAMVGGRLRT
jgi:AcrR family transcriptional regulator